MKYFIGIDQSFRSTGLVMIDEEGSLKEFARIDFEQIRESNEAVDELFTEMEDYGAPRVYSLIGKCNVVSDNILMHLFEWEGAWADPMKDQFFYGMEEVSFGSTGNQTRELPVLQATIANSIFSDKSEIVETVGISTLKKFATGRGNAPKQAMIDDLPEEVREKFKERNFKKTTGLGDLADAYWIARWRLDNEKRTSGNSRQDGGKTGEAKQ